LIRTPPQRITCPGVYCLHPGGLSEPGPIETACSLRTKSSKPSGYPRVAAIVTQTAARTRIGGVFMFLLWAGGRHRRRSVADIPPRYTTLHTYILFIPAHRPCTQRCLATDDDNTLYFREKSIQTNKAVNAFRLDPCSDVANTAVSIPPPRSLLRAFIISSYCMY